jgi:heme exporter protein B
MLANLITMLVMEALVLPLLVLFLNIDLWSCMPQILLPVFLGSLGFAAVGTLFAAMSINTRLQEALLPMLTLPILVPALLAAVESFGAILAGDPLSEVSSWLELSLAFSVLFITISLLLFDYVVEE